MKIKEYLKDKVLLIVFLIFDIISFWMMGYAFHVSIPYVIAVSAILLSCIIIFFAVDFIKRKVFYDDFFLKLDRLDQKYLITEMLKQPGFAEGDIICEALYHIDKSMKDRISGLEASQSDFKEYIEMWVHEAKIPIQGIMLMNYSMEQKTGSTVLKNQQAELFRLENYVEQILYMARAEHPEKDYLLKETELIPVINRVVKNNKELLIGNKISIEKKNLGLSVVTDSKWLEFMLGQIVNNSIKYSKETAGRICFYAQKLSDRIVLIIEDNGIGVCVEDIARVFEKTFTGKNGRRRASSTGMGLYICKRLCERLGHNIRMESKEGEYTKIIIEFGIEDYYKMTGC